MVAYLANLWSVMLELSPWLLLGAAIAGALHVVVPPGFVHRQLRGPGGVLKAVLLGVPLPLCSCGVIPAGLGLKKDGASDGASVAFLTATPQTGVDSVLVSAGFLGWPFALTKVGAALVTGSVAGWATDAASPAGAAAALPTAHAGSRRSVAEGVAHGVDLVRMIWRWLVFGVVVSAALTTWLPADAFSSLVASGTLITFAAVLGVSLPLYVCATASVPIAAALVAGGMPTGAALVFLMAGPATNVATVGAVHKGFGPRTLAVYLGTIVVGSIGFGLAYEAVFGDLAVATVASHAHAAWWHQVAAMVLVGLFAWFAGEEVRTMFGWLKARRSEAREITFGVEGMSCNGCASRLQRVLEQTDGVEAAAVSFDDGRAVVKGIVDVGTVEEAVRAAGFSPVR